MTTEWPYDNVKQCTKTFVRVFVDDPSIIHEAGDLISVPCVPILFLAA